MDLKKVAKTSNNSNDSNNSQHYLSFNYCHKEFHLHMAEFLDPPLVSFFKIYWRRFVSHLPKVFTKCLKKYQEECSIIINLQASSLQFYKNWNPHINFSRILRFYKIAYCFFSSADSLLEYLLFCNFTTKHTS